MQKGKKKYEMTNKNNEKNEELRKRKRKRQEKYCFHPGALTLFAL